MRTPIYLRRGNKVDLPVLLPGEPGFAMDTKELYIGASGGNIQLAKLDSKIAQILNGGYKIQSAGGSLNIATAGAAASTTINFPVAYGSTPIILVTLQAAQNTGTYINLSTNIQSSTNFTVTGNSGVAQTLFFNWLSIGS